MVSGGTIILSKPGKKTDVIHLQLDADEAFYKLHGEPLFSSHMIDLSEEEFDWNLDTTAKYLERATPMKQWLEMEIGITGGEEDGVNNGEIHRWSGDPTRDWRLIGIHQNPSTTTRCIPNPKTFSPSTTSYLRSVRTSRSRYVVYGHVCQDKY